MQNTDKQQGNGGDRYGIVLNGKLYNALPPGKGILLLNFMNEQLSPNISTARIHAWFKNAASNVPKQHYEYYLELMSDALRFTAENLKGEMSEKAIGLRKDYDKAAAELAAVKNELEKDKIIRTEKLEEEQR